MANEQARFDRVSNFRVPAVEDAYFRNYKPNPLYVRPKPWEVEEGFEYSDASKPKGKFASVEEALKAVRAKLDGS